MTDSDKRERRAHFRGKARPGRRVDLEYRTGGDSAPVRAHTRNIGVGGAFIVSTAPHPIGTKLIVAILVPTATHPIEVAAEVRWVYPDKDGETGGMGVKFGELDVEQLLALSEYFASLTGAEVALVDAD